MNRDEARAAGRLMYETGQPCRRGHIAARYVSNGECTVCHARRGTGGFKDVEVPTQLVDLIRATVDAAIAVPLALRVRCQTDAQHNLWIDGLWVGQWDDRGGLERYMWWWLIDQHEEQLRRTP